MGELAAQGVEEEGVDDAVYVLHAGVVHPAAAARVGVEGALEEGAEDGGRDAAPVEIVARVLEEQGHDFGREAGYLDVRLGKEAAVDVGEGQESLPLVGVAPGGGRVEDAEEVDERTAGLLGRVLGQVVMELPVAAEEAGVFGIEAEDETHAEHVEAAQRGRTGGVAVLAEQRVVEPGHDFARLEGNFLLGADVAVAAVDEELQPPAVLRQAREQDFLGLAPRLFHVVDQEGAEVAGHNPAGAQGKGQAVGIALGLHVRSEGHAVALQLGLAQVAPEGFLLDEHAGRADIGIHEARSPVGPHRHLEVHDPLGLLHAEHVPEQGQPERLGLSFLVAAPLPLPGKAAGGFLLRLFVHIRHDLKGLGAKIVQTSETKALFRSRMQPACVGKTKKNCGRRRAVFRSL